MGKKDCPTLKAKGENYESWLKDLEAFCFINYKTLPQIHGKPYPTPLIAGIDIEALHLAHPYLDKSNTLCDAQRRNAMLFSHIIMATSGEAKERIHSACGAEMDGFKALAVLRSLYGKTVHTRANLANQQ